MAPKFQGKIALDIRDSEPDWAPYLSPKAPEGAPNVLLIAWDDVGYGTMDVFGGPVETPTMRHIPHNCAVLTDPRLAADGAQRDLEWYGYHRRVQLGLPWHLHPHSVRKWVHLGGTARARL